MDLDQDGEDDVVIDLRKLKIAVLAAIAGIGSIITAAVSVIQLPRLLDPNNTEWNGLLELLKEEGNTGTFTLKEPVPYIPPEVVQEIERGDFTVNDMNRLESLMTRVDYDEVEQKIKRAAKDTAKKIVKGFNWFGDKAEDRKSTRLNSHSDLVCRLLLEKKNYCNLVYLISTSTPFYCKH